MLCITEERESRGAVESSPATSGDGMVSFFLIPQPATAARDASARVIQTLPTAYCL
jgi:hypothetical protein